MTRHQRGFTLIEMLISLSIFALITGFTAANYRTGRRTDELRQGSQLLASSIRRAQTMALAGEGVFLCAGNGSACTSDAACGSGNRCLQNVCVSATAKVCSSNSDCSGGVSCTRSYPSGYGVRVTTAANGRTQSILFVDVDGDRTFDATEAIRTDSLGSGPFVSVTSLSPVTPGGTLDLVFEPPKPTLYFNGSIATTTASITVTHSGSGGSRTVTVNRVTGQVSAD